MIGFSLVFNVFVQAVLGFSPLRAAFAGCAYALGMAVAAAVGSAVLVPRFGRRVLTIGFLTMMVGAGLMALTVHLTGLTAQAWQFLPAGFVFGIGGGLAIVPVFSIILAGVGDHEVGSASGLLNALQQLGGTIGVAVSGTLFFELLAKGPLHAMEVTTLVAAAFVFGALVLVQLLPRQARDEAHLRDLALTPPPHAPDGGVPGVLSRSTRAPYLVSVRVYHGDDTWETDRPEGTTVLSVTAAKFLSSGGVRTLLGAGLDPDLTSLARRPVHGWAAHPVSAF